MQVAIQIYGLHGKQTTSYDCYYNSLCPQALGSHRDGVGVLHGHILLHSDIMGQGNDITYQAIDNKEARP